jgi:hypothetical protein
MAVKSFIVLALSEARSQLIEGKNMRYSLKDDIH